MHLQTLAITINQSLIGHDQYYEAGSGAPHAPTRSCPKGQKIFKNLKISCPVVAEELAKAKQQAADPNTQWADHEIVWETLHEQYDV